MATKTPVANQDSLKEQSLCDGGNKKAMLSSAGTKLVSPARDTWSSVVLVDGVMARGQWCGSWSCSCSW